jgi:hypothetical protein
MQGTTDTPDDYTPESTSPYISADNKTLHQAAHRALNHYLKPSGLTTAKGRTPITIFVVAPEVDNETLLAHACESLASANLMASDFAGTLEGGHRNMMLALQQVIMLSELAVNRVLDNVGAQQQA